MELGFARADEDVRGPVSLERVLVGTLSVAHNDLRYRARVVRDYAPVPLEKARELVAEKYARDEWNRRR